MKRNPCLGGALPPLCKVPHPLANKAPFAFLLFCFFPTIFTPRPPHPILPVMIPDTTLKLQLFRSL